MRCSVDIETEFTAYSSSFTIATGFYLEMALIRCRFRASFALNRVFSIPVASRSLAVQQKALPITISSAARQARSFAARGPKPQSTARRLPTDHLIRASRVHIVQSDGSLSHPQNPRTVLSTIDLKTQSLVTVSEPSKDPASDMPTIPVCRIINKKEQFASKTGKKSRPAANMTTKTLELNWAIDPHDLGHRLNKMEEFLGKGNKVEVKLAAKGRRKGRRATPEEAHEVLSKIRGVLLDAEGVQRNGWKETQQMSGVIGEVATLYFEGKAIERENNQSIEASGRNSDKWDEMVPSTTS